MWLYKIHVQNDSSNRESPGGHNLELNTWKNCSCTPEIVSSAIRDWISFCIDLVAKVMFSVVSNGKYVQRGRGSHVTTTCTYSNMFNWEPNVLAAATPFFTIKGLPSSSGPNSTPLDMFKLVHWWYLFLMQIHMKSIILLNFLMLQKQVHTLPVDHSNNRR